MPAQVIVLKNFHPDIEFSQAIKHARSEADIPEVDRDVFYMISDSQFQMARYITKNSDAAVILENMKGMDRSFKFYHEVAMMTKSIFPNGLPSSYAQLSFTQKKYLHDHGGVQYVLFSGIIEKTYDDDLTYKDNRAIIEGEELDLNKKTPLKAAKINQQREYYSLAQAQKISEKTNKRVLLVMGAVHPFTDIAPCFPKIKLSFENFIPAIPAATELLQHKTVRAEIAARPPMNCQALSRGFFAKQHTKANEAPLSAVKFSYATAFAGIFAIGLFAFALFMCCKRYGKNKPTHKSAASRHFKPT